MSSKPNLDPVSAIAVQLAIQHEEPGVVFVGELLDEIDPTLTKLVPTHLQPRTVTARFCPIDEVPYESLRKDIEKCDFYRFRVIAMDGKAMVVSVDELRRVSGAS